LAPDAAQVTAVIADMPPVSPRTRPVVPVKSEAKTTLTIANSSLLTNETKNFPDASQSIY